MLAASRQLYPPALVIAIFAKTFRVELGVRMLTLSDLTYLFPICSLLEDGSRRFLLADLLDGGYLLVDLIRSGLSLLFLLRFFGASLYGSQ